MDLIKLLNRLFKEYTGLRLFPTIGFVVLLAASGATMGLVFPKYEANALLQVYNEGVDLPTFKRVFASYASADEFKAFLDAAGSARSAAESRLVLQAESASFWSKAVSPVFPLTKKDQRESAGLKETATNTLLGIDLTTDARSTKLSAEMISVLARYVTNAIMRERIREWILAGKAHAANIAKAAPGDIMRTEFDIELLERRIADTKKILARYPNVTRADGRLMISPSEVNGGDRFLSPLAQLIGLETEISKKQALVRRFQRNLEQQRLFATFFAEAEKLFDGIVTVGKLLPALRQLATKTLATADGSQAWVKEVEASIIGELDNFGATQTQLGVRGAVRVAGVASRNPLRLASLLSLLGVVAVGALAFLRATRTAAIEDEPSE